MEVKVTRKEQVRVPHLSLLTLFLQKLRYDEGLSSGKMLFSINASVTSNCKRIGHIPFSSHLRG